MNRRKTSNTQHPTSNNQWFPIGPLIGGWVLDVGWTALRTLVAAGLAIAIEFCPVAQASERHPNVLFIAIDDLNDWVGCLGGHPQARTPNIDRLAARGTLFLNAHVQAPLCNPSRASLLTGLRPSTTGIYGLAPGIRGVAATKDCVTLPQYFAADGYFTATFGKVFHDGSIPPPAFRQPFRPCVR